MTFPEKEKETEDISKKMESTFTRLFRDSDGKPKPLNVEIGKEYGSDVTFDDYFKEMMKDK